MGSLFTNVPILMTVLDRQNVLIQVSQHIFITRMYHTRSVYTPLLIEEHDWLLQSDVQPSQGSGVQHLGHGWGAFVVLALYCYLDIVISTNTWGPTDGGDLNKTSPPALPRLKSPCLHCKRTIMNHLAPYTHCSFKHLLMKGGVPRVPRLP